MSLSTINSKADKLASGNTDWRRYVVWYLSTLLLACTLVAGFNAVIDPQARILIVEKPGFNQVKTRLKSASRKGKTTALRQCSYDTLVLGTSRAEMAMAMDAPPLNDGRSYNAALKAGSMYEIRRIAEYALLNQNLDVVLLSLDFVAFNADLIYEEDFSDSPLAETVSLSSLAKYLVSLQTLRESLDTLKGNTRGNAETCVDTGKHVRKYKQKPARVAFDGILRQYSKGPYKRHASGDFHLRHLASLLRDLADADVAVYAFISPAHVVHFELMKEMDLLDEYEDWKRDLVRLFAEANQDLPEQQHAVLWDFSGFSEITTEKVPPPGDESFMRWYSDSSHANPSVGTMMTNKIFGLRSETTETVAAFGVQLSTDNIEATIEKARRDSERYRRENPAEIARIQKIQRAAP